MTKNDGRWVYSGADQACPICHGDGLEAYRDGARLAARVCSCVGECALCGGTGFVASGTDRASPVRRCHCQHLKVRIRRLSEAAIPARHDKSTRLSFKPTNHAQTAVLARVSSWLKAYSAGETNRGLILYGDVGRGKTHLMVALLRDLIVQRGVSGRFVEFSHLLADLKSGFQHRQSTSALLKPLSEVQVLGIDELGKGRNTSFEGTILDELVSRRYNADLPILGTTNYAPGPSSGVAVGNAADVDRAGRARQRPALVDRVGDRVYSRLREMCDFVGVTGEDYRERRP